MSHWPSRPESGELLTVKIMARVGSSISKRLERGGIFGIGDGFADLNAFDAGDGDDVAGGDGFGFVAIEAAKGDRAW